MTDPLTPPLVPPVGEEDDPWEKAPRYDLMTNYRCGTSIEEMERADDGEWVRWEEVEKALAQTRQQHAERERQLREAGDESAVLLSRANDALSASESREAALRAELEQVIDMHRSELAELHASYQSSERRAITAEAFIETLKQEKAQQLGVAMKIAERALDAWSEADRYDLDQQERFRLSDELSAISLHQEPSQ